MGSKWDQFQNLYPGGSPPAAQYDTILADSPGFFSARRDQATASTALNVSAILAMADTEPERNPRNEGGEVLSNLYRRLGRVEGRTSYLEQNS